MLSVLLPRDFKKTQEVDQAGSRLDVRLAIAIGNEDCVSGRCLVELYFPCVLQPLPLASQRLAHDQPLLQGEEGQNCRKERQLTTKSLAV